MAYELINSGSHQNDVALFRYKEHSKDYYLKVSLCNDANKVLEKEFEGYKWFSETIKKELCNVELIKKHFYELKIPKYNGIKFPDNSTLDKNRVYVEKIILFYKDRWPINEKFAVHGDLALNNIIFSEKDINIIDWEHFHLSEIQNYGVDIINMVFILLSNQVIKDFNLSYSTLEFLKKCYRILLNGNDSMKIAGRPFCYARQYIINNKHNYREGINIEEKFCITKFDERALEKLDRHIVGQ